MRLAVERSTVLPLRSDYADLRQDRSTRLVYSEEQLRNALSSGEVKSVYVAGDINLEDQLTIATDNFTLNGSWGNVLTANHPIVISADYVAFDGLAIQNAQFEANSTRTGCQFRNLKLTPGDDLLEGTWLQMTFTNCLLLDEADIDGTWGNCVFAFNRSVQQPTDIQLAAGYGSNIIMGNQMGSGEVDTSASAGSNTIVGNSSIGVLITHGSDSAGNNT